MTRDPKLRLLDMISACEAITRYLQRADSDDDMLFDAIRARLIEIVEATKDVPPTLFATEPSIPWSDIIRMRDSLAHRYFDTSKTIVWVTARDDIPELEAAVRRIVAGYDRP